MKALIVIALLILPVLSTNPACSLCRWSFDTLRSFFLFILDDFISFIIYACNRFTSKGYCDLLIGNFKEPITSLTYTINGTVICSRLSFCTNPRIVKDEDSAYLSRVLIDVPPRKPYESIFNVSDTYKILVFNDPHIDFKYTKDRSSECEKEVCCRHDSPIEDEPSKRAGKYGFVGKCDLPQITFDNFIKKVAEINPDVVLGLGDYNGHNAYEQTKETHLDILRYLAKVLRGNYSGPVYLVTGNHDGFPDGQFDVIRGKSQWILDGYADILSQWYTEKGTKTVREYGRFSELVNDTKLRIIGLNNFVMDYTNVYLYENATDALQQLKWLEEQLEHTKENQEFAIIIGHIAPQSKSGERTWGIRYAALMEKYANVVRGQFFGHMHEDYFYPIMSFLDHSELVNVVNIHPAMSTFSRVYPSFRVYEMNKDNYELVDYHQYSLNVTKKNEDESTDWTISYSFKEFHNLENMNPKNYLNIIKSMITDPKYFNKMYNIMYTKSSKGNSSSDPQRRAQIMCKFTTGYFYEYINCMNETFGSFSDFMRFIVLGKHVFPDWRHATITP